MFLQIEGVHRWKIFHVVYVIEDGECEALPLPSFSSPIPCCT